MSARNVFILILMLILGLTASVTFAAGKQDVVKPRGEITFAISGMKFELDAHRITAGGPRQYIMEMADALFRRDTKGNLYGDVAESWKISPDGRIWEFKIRKGMTFHNGEPVTAEDVAYSIERVMCPEMEAYGMPPIRKKFERVEVIDKWNIKIYFNSALAEFPDRNFIFMAVVPKKYCEETLGGDIDAFMEKPIYSGSFKFSGQKVGEWLEIEANENHYARVPHVKKIRFVIVPESGTRLAMLKTGEADMIRDIPWSMAPEINKDPNLRVISAVGYTTGHLYTLAGWRPESSPIKDKRVRQALDYSIDRDAISRDIFYGKAVPVATSIAPWSLGFDPNIKPRPYDLKKARSLLVEAGYPDGFKMNFDVCNPDLWLPVAEMMQASWKKIGIDAKLVIHPGYSFYEKWAAHTVKGDIGIAAWGAAAVYEPLGITAPWETGGKFNYWPDQFPELDALWAKARGTVDVDKRAKITPEIQRMMQDIATNIGFVSTDAIFGVGPRIKEYTPRWGAGYAQDLWTIKLSEE